MEDTKSRPRPPEAGKVRVVAQEKLTNVPGKTLTVQVVDMPPRGKVPEHHHGGPTVVYILSGAFRLQLEGGREGVYRAGETFFEPAGAVHALTQNISETDPAQLMLIHVADDGNELVVIH